ASGLAAAHNSGEPVTPTPIGLGAPAVAGQATLSLDSRLGLEEGDVLRIGAAPDEEFATIKLPPGRAAPPDSGKVGLTHPLANSHPQNAPVTLLTETPVSTTPPVALALHAGPQTDVLLATGSTGLAPGDLIRLTTPTGDVFRHTLTKTAVASNAVLLP